jgi:TolB-like protein/Tfp pilus assembly protein PilF
MNDRAQAIFISYASQDAGPAHGICAALRAAGLNVWFDQSELRGGDTWDASIRQQIKECALFIPIISAHTQEREEGYFRREWNLAVNRTLDMAQDRAFLLPVVIDATTDANARVPEKFRELQWTRLPGGETTAAFVDHVRRLLSARDAVAPESSRPLLASASGAAMGASVSGPGTATPLSTRYGWAIALVLGAAVAIAALAFVMHNRSPPPAGASPAPAAFAPPAHSIAVLPFVNMSGDPKQEYFSDGLSEELLNSLATVHDLQVAARTSSFSFKGKDVKLADIGRELNVGAVLEGSVRKEGNHVRITVELINAVTGFNQWSQTYDRDLKNILSLQTEIATAVTTALQATLLPDAAATFELGDTRDPAAFDAYLRGEKLAGRFDEASGRVRVAAYDEAIRDDPAFAKAYVGLSLALSILAGNGHLPEYAAAQAAAEKAVALAPDLGRAHTALAYALQGHLDFVHAVPEHKRALALSPGDSFVLQYTGLALAQLNYAEGLPATTRALTLDPLNAISHLALGASLFASRQYQPALDALDRAVTLDPALGAAETYRGEAYIKLGKLDAALKSCRTPPLDINSYVCMGVVYKMLGQTAEAQSALKQLRDTGGDAAAWQMVELYASWGDTDTAIQWLQTAVRLRDPGLVEIRTDPRIDSLRQNPRFQAIERELKFPD